MNLFKQQQENKVIALSIDFFKRGIWNDRQTYVKALDAGHTVKLNGFSFTLDTMCYCVWKNSDNNEPMFKIIPRSDLSIKQIYKIVSAQPWTWYLNS